MNPFENSPFTDPTTLFRQRDGVFAVDLLTAAIVEFDVITELGDRSLSLDEICLKFGTSKRPTDVMMTLLAAHGLVEVTGGEYRVTPLGREHLDSSSPWCLRNYYSSLQDRPVARDMVKCYEPESQPTGAVRMIWKTGTTR